MKVLSEAMEDLPKIKKEGGLPSYEERPPSDIARNSVQ